METILVKAELPKLLFSMDSKNFFLINYLAPMKVVYVLVLALFVTLSVTIANAQGTISKKKCVIKCAEDDDFSMDEAVKYLVYSYASYCDDDAVRAW
jgi:hypothetical protein